MRDVTAADPQEQMAREKGLTYVKLDGEVGILGNGAGLVMSTLDVVAQAGGRAANFLDVGGVRRRRRSSTPRGDHVRCQGARDPVQHLRRHHALRRGGAGHPDALDGRDIGVPMVVRLDGTSDEEGRRLLADANPPGVYVERTMLDAARRAVELAGAAA
jgi:succinyl-CoA synthetase beta subunit